MTARLAVFVSGGGSNLQAIQSYFDRRRSVATVALTVSNSATCGAIARARESGQPHVVLNDPGDADRILGVLGDHHITHIALAGYLKLLPAAVVHGFRGRVVNVHPALLPKHGGAGMYGHRVHAAVLAAGEGSSGCTVHFVDTEYDRGAIIAQASVPVLADDSPQTLAARVLVAEHFLYPRAVHALVAAAVSLDPSGGVKLTSGAAQYFSDPPAGVSTRLGG
ncbi:MAG: phosphoribosylglycinamide formyltransferase [Gemmatimonadetes bacterium]|nr:phosphoribosylglycinamide formyltransferase [Gemmatimonadota bacterium]